MIYHYYDPKGNEEYDLELHRLPYISITKEQAIQMSKLLNDDEMAKVMQTFIHCVYNAECKEGCLECLNKVERITIESLFDQLCRINLPYFKKLQNLKNVNYQLK